MDVKLLQNLLLQSKKIESKIYTKKKSKYIKESNTQYNTKITSISQSHSYSRLHLH